MQVLVSVAADLAAGVQHRLPDITVFFTQTARLYDREEGHMNPVLVAQFNVPHNIIPPGHITVVNRDADLFLIPVPVLKHEVLQDLLVAFRAGQHRQQRTQAQQQRQHLLQFLHPCSSPEFPSLYEITLPASTDRVSQVLPPITQ